MGMTFATLQLWGVEREAAEPLLQPGDLLREQNAPWLGVTPAHDELHGEARRLEQLAKRLTRGRDAAAALLFDYFDDELFSCSLYRNGRRTATCRSGESWAGLGKQLNALFGEDAPAKALRYASRCADLEEQLALLEQTVGAALYDIPEEEPRRVPRGDGTLREIKAREAALRKRPNQYVLTELPPEDWPGELTLRRGLMELLRPRWEEYHLATLLYQLNMQPFLVPGARDMLAFPFTDFSQRRDGVVFYGGDTGEHWELSMSPTPLGRAVWQTRGGGTALLFSWITQEREDGSGWSRSGRQSGVICLARSGAELWRFEPLMHPHQTLAHVHSDADGVVTLFAAGFNAAEKADALIWQIDGETGETQRCLRIPAEKEVHHLVFAKALNAFVFCERRAGNLIVLNDELQETARWSGYRGDAFFGTEQFCGALLYERLPHQGEMRLFDLQSGRAFTRSLEIPVFSVRLLPDGRALGLNEAQKALTVFDPAGRVAARCSVPGLIGHWIVEEDRVCACELRGPDTHGLVYGELFDETTVHVWRLDPVEKKET